MNLTLLLAIPALTAMLAGFVPERTSRWVGLGGALIIFLFSICMVCCGWALPGVSFHWLPGTPLSYDLHLDGLGKVMLLLTSIIIPFVLILSGDHITQGIRKFTILVLCTQLALIGVFLAGNPFTFYLFFELTLIPVYFLCADWGGERRKEVTLRFLIYTLAGSLLMLAALVYIYSRSLGVIHTWEDAYQIPIHEQIQIYIFIALFIAFAIKSPLFPFHSWQVDLYTESSPPVTVLLSGLMSKLGIFGIIRLLLPMTKAAQGICLQIVLVLAIIGVIYGALIAIQRRNIKQLLAFASLSHLGLIAAGLFAQNTLSWEGAVFQSFVHGINAAMLFYIAGVLEHKTGGVHLDQIQGVAHVNRLLSTYFIIGTLGMVALPLTNGFVGEFLLLWGISQSHLGLAIIACLTIVLGAVYMLKLFQGAMYGELTTQGAKVTALSRPDILVLTICSLLVIGLGVFPGGLMEVFRSQVGTYLSWLTQ